MLRLHRTTKIRRMVIRTKATNQRAKTRVDNMEDTKDIGDIVVDTVYLKEDKVVEGNVTRSYLTRRIILSLSLRTILRIILNIINIPFIGRRAITR